MRWSRLRWWLAGGAVIAVMAVLTLGVPSRLWRTGRAAPPLPLSVAEALVAPTDRLWIDTDAACGAGARVDPDDCFAVALLLRARAAEVAGISTVFGNAPLAVTDATTRALVDVLGARAQVGVFRGTEGPAGKAASDARAALQQALGSGPLTIVALGPLTNIAGALAGRTDLQANVKRLIAVMGHQPGHIFHPTEGAPGATLLGHGPVFRDFNFAQDQDAARRVVAMNLPLTLVPYDASRTLMLEAADLVRMGAGDAAGRWIAARSRAWHAYWQADIAQNGFYPFDLAAAAYVLHPKSFSCARVSPRIIKRNRFWSLILGESELVVEAAAEGDARTLYCPHVEPRLKEQIVATIAGG